MCLAVPAEIVDIKGEKATISIGGIRRSVVISLIEEPKVGEYVIVHAGFAIQKWSQEDLAEYNQIIREMKAQDE
ncbi:MAG: HypC/HybG/HupF family hydrogenase formation chaperone [Chitinispirillia bacterium]|jgi:hydrogenase expression/formation protein HypC